MNASEMIGLLFKLRAEHGDLDVVGEDFESISDIELSIDEDGESPNYFLLY